jgi:hypothetical protein
MFVPWGIIPFIYRFGGQALPFSRRATIVFPGRQWGHLIVTGSDDTRMPRVSLGSVGLLQELQTN